MLPLNKYLRNIEPIFMDTIRNHTTLQSIHYSNAKTVDVCLRAYNIYLHMKIFVILAVMFTQVARPHTASSQHIYMRMQYAFAGILT